MSILRGEKNENINEMNSDEKFIWQDDLCIIRLDNIISKRLFNPSAIWFITRLQC